MVVSTTVIVHNLYTNILFQLNNQKLLLILNLLIKQKDKRNSLYPFIFYYSNPIDTYCVSKNASIPSRPPSRPNPLSFIPPNGACAADGVPSFQPTIP